MRTEYKLYQKDLKVALENSLGINQLAGKSVLVTGATGTIGSFLVDEFLMFNQLHDKKISIYATSRNLKRLRETFHNESTSQLHFVEFDNLNPVRFNFKVDYIIHNAGSSSPKAFNQNPIGTIMGNVTSTYNLLQYADQSNVKRFLYVSSGEVYGQDKMASQGFSEGHTGHVEPLSERSCYPNSKRLCETLCAAFAEKRLINVGVVRPCHTFGPKITNNDNRAHAQFLKAALFKDSITLKSSGKQLRSYCYIADCAAGIVTVLLNGEKNSAYNIANPDAVTTIRNFAETTARIAGKKVDYINAEPNKNDSPIQHQVLDPSRLQSLGWHSHFTLATGIEHTLKIMQQERDRNAGRLKETSL
ncbi:NAD-dependent epimerase/dehydratase family protein [Liquorilactobacillus vini]|uniref:NAD-dependent epimerase/dehydratase family protein n=1 Tax=Liquorilactobacillus vini TaxID=238015 RepID=UPI000307E224|nr:NAD-dependent epimerase/dehydratase family protein [Liquorilactobacillus vini]